MAGKTEKVLLDSWEDFLLDTPAENPPAAANTSKNQAQISAKAKMKIEQQRIEEKFAEESFDFLLGNTNLQHSGDATSKAVDKEAAPKKSKENREAHKMSLKANLQAVDLSSFTEAENAAHILASKIQSSTLASAAYYRFIDILFQACLQKIETADLEAMAKKLTQYITDKKLDKNLREMNKKKLSKVWKENDLKDELEIVYGGGYDSEEEEDYSDYNSESHNTDEFDDGF